MPIKIPEVITIDFESIGIERRPHYPPSPVGVSIKLWKQKPRYYAWGHITGGNNCSYNDAKRALVKAYNSRYKLLFQNSKFDLAVSEEHFDLPIPDWERVHDTLLLIFLDDPHQSTFSLKPSAERLLNIPPEERDVVEDWLVEHQPIKGIKITRGRGTNAAGKYIAYAPGNIVGPYANGDTDRTERLFIHLLPSIINRGMEEAYNRERIITPILHDIEKPGVKVDEVRLARDVERYNTIRDQVTDWCLKRLRQNGNSEFNLDSNAQLLDALQVTGKVDESKLLITAKGNPSASKESLGEAVNDRLLQSMLAYRSELNTCLNTFMENWLYTADQSGCGRIYTDWNQVRQDSKNAKGLVGTSTGRLSSTPNFQNVSNKFKPQFKHLALAEGNKDLAKKLVKCPFDLPPLPLVRSYITPFDGEILIDRDYSQQELRILAHYEGGPLTQAYLENTWLDVHQWATDMINELLAAQFERRPIKDIGFGLIYGMGVGKLAIKAETTVDIAKRLKKAYLTVAPGLGDLYSDMKRRARNGEPIYTWGGREYYCEEPKIVEGRLRTFDYKLVNVLVQGSAADCTKQAIIEYYKRKPSAHKLILNVHDQLTSSIPPDDLVEGMEILRESMEAVKFDVPMLSEGSWSKTNWDKASLIDYDKKGVILYAS